MSDLGNSSNSSGSEAARAVKNHSSNSNLLRAYESGMSCHNNTTFATTTRRAFKNLKSALEDSKGKKHVSLRDKRSLEDAASLVKYHAEMLLDRLDQVDSEKASIRDVYEAKLQNALLANAEHQKTIAGKDKTLETLRYENSKLKQNTEKLEAKSEEQMDALNAKSEIIDRTKHQLGQKKHAISLQNTTVAELKSTLALKDKELNAPEENMAQKDQELTQLRETMEQKAAETEMLWDRVARLQGESKKRQRKE
jgi:chromosome segregation ATPase